jgi:hypothetical protein
MSQRIAITFLSALVALSSLLQSQAAIDAALKGPRSVVKHDAHGCPAHRCRLSSGHDLNRLLPNLNKGPLAIAGLPPAAVRSLTIANHDASCQASSRAAALHALFVKWQV